MYVQSSTEGQRSYVEKQMKRENKGNSSATEVGNLCPTAGFCGYLMERPVNESVRW